MVLWSRLLKKYKQCRFEVFKNSQFCGKDTAEWNDRVFIKYYDKYAEEVHCDIGTVKYSQVFDFWMLLSSCSGIRIRKLERITSMHRLTSATGCLCYELFIETDV